MSEYLEETMRTTVNQTHELDASAFFRQGGPERWIRVVTEFGGDADRVVTAFPQSDDPRQGGWRR